MTEDPVVVSPETSVQDALKLMKTRGFGRLPVVSKNKLVGIVTEADLMKVSPSPATSLSIFEINYLVSKIKVSEAMTKKVVTVSPDDTAESAVLTMRDNDIGGVPVVDGDRLIGIITESNVFEALIKLFDLRRAGTRITVEIPDRLGVIAEITDLIRKNDVSIISLATFTGPDADAATLVIKVATSDYSSIVAGLEEAGYQVSHVTASA